MSEIVCGLCGLNLAKPGPLTGAGWDRGPVAHCRGMSKAFKARLRGDAHHWHELHRPCRNCGADLGCFRCSGPANELLCMNCRDWGSDEAFREHGPLLKGRMCCVGGS